MLASVSPSIIILRPPEKLVIEIESNGGYNYTLWSKQGKPSRASAESYVHFGEIYYVANTTLNDLGRYRVAISPSVSTQIVPPDVFIDVILQGRACSYLFV